MHPAIVNFLSEHIEILKKGNWSEARSRQLGSIWRGPKFIENRVLGMQNGTHFDLWDNCFLDHDGIKVYLEIRARPCICKSINAFCRQSIFNFENDTFICCSMVQKVDSNSGHLGST